MTRRQNVPAKKPPSSLRMVQAGDRGGPNREVLRVSRGPDGVADVILELDNLDYLDGMSGIGITLTQAQRRKLGEFLLREDG